MAAAEHRVVIGASEGGYSAMEIGLRYPHVFGGVAAQSILPIGMGDRQMLDTIEMHPALPVRIYLDWGRYDPVDPRDGTDVPAFGRRLKAALLENGYKVSGREWNDGPDVPVLATRLQEMLKAWFPVGP
jgi:pimeloyl-ACP methyl ester carboxylesterase